jgi:hypothetical protein
MAEFRIITGQSFDFYKKITVSRTTFGDPTDGYRQDFLIPFSTYGLILVNENPGTAIQLSFNGVDVHEELSTAVGLTTVTYSNRAICKIWAKVATGSAALSVRAWSVR